FYTISLVTALHQRLFRKAIISSERYAPWSRIGKAAGVSKDNLPKRPEIANDIFGNSMGWLSVRAVDKDRIPSRIERPHGRGFEARSGLSSGPSIVGGWAKCFFRIKFPNEPARQHDYADQKRQSQPWGWNYFAFEEEGLVGKEGHHANQDCQVGVRRNEEGEENGEDVGSKKITFMHPRQGIWHDQNRCQGKPEKKLRRESRPAFAGRDNKIIAIAAAHSIPTGKNK